MPAIDPAAYQPKAPKKRSTDIFVCSSLACEEAIRAELEERDYDIEKNVFWASAFARWITLQDSAKLLPAGTEITVKNAKITTYKITSTGKLIYDAVEKKNPNLGNVLANQKSVLDASVFLN
ncbi:MAG: hypothetical protein ABI162_13475 [Luteolibacter sp.]